MGLHYESRCEINRFDPLPSSPIPCYHSFSLSLSLSLSRFCLLSRFCFRASYLTPSHLTIQRVTNGPTMNTWFPRVCARRVVDTHLPSNADATFSSVIKRSLQPFESFLAIMFHNFIHSGNLTKSQVVEKFISWIVRGEGVSSFISKWKLDNEWRIYTDICWWSATSWKD